jgi:hypothetical protein
MLVVLCSWILSFSAQARDYRFLDSEMHFVDPQQRTDGIQSLLENMDLANVDKSVLTGFSVTKKWAASEPKRPRYYSGDDAPVYWYSATDQIVYDAIKSLPEKEQERFIPFITGFNPTDLNAVEHVERMLKRDPGFWQGIGEVFTRHDELTALTEGEKPVAPHPALIRVLKLAARYHLPVMLHSNITSIREREPIYLGELEQALAASPETTIIWAHAGMSAAIDRRQDFKGLVNIANGLLDKYDNLNILLSWTLVKKLYDKEGKPREEWLSLVNQYPHRFILGSDKVGRFGRLKEGMDELRPFLDALPEETAHKVASTNLLQWLPPKQ